MVKIIKVKAVIFDMDGVITNTMPDHFRAWKNILAKEGVPVTHNDIYSREGQRGLTSIYEIFHHYKKSVMREKAHELLGKKERLFNRIVKETRFIHGTRQFIRDLDRRHFKLGLVTGTSRHELQRILPSDLYQRFDAIVTGTDVKNGKPHPEPYRRSMKMLKVKPLEAIAIENAPFGIRSAKAAGLRCLALETSLSRQYLKGASAVFKTVKKLRANIKFILSE